MKSRPRNRAEVGGATFGGTRARVADGVHSDTMIMVNDWKRIEQSALFFRKYDHLRPVEVRS